MKRIAQTVLLRDDPEIIRKYEEYHAHPFSEVILGLKTQGIQRAYIYRYGRLLFFFIEAVDDYNPDAEKGLSAEIQKRLGEWGEIMTSYQERLPGAPGNPGTKWTQMTEIFTFER